MVQGNAAAALTFQVGRPTLSRSRIVKAPRPPLDLAGRGLPRRTTLPSGSQWPHEIKHDSPAGAASDPPGLATRAWDGPRRARGRGAQCLVLISTLKK